MTEVISREWKRLAFKINFSDGVAVGWGNGSFSSLAFRYPLSWFVV